MALRQLSPYLCRIALLAFALTQLSPAGIFFCQNPVGEMFLGCNCTQPMATLPSACCEHCQDADSPVGERAPLGYGSDRCGCEHHAVPYTGCRAEQRAPQLSLLAVTTVTLPTTYLAVLDQFEPVASCANSPPGLSPPHTGTAPLPLRI